MHGDKSEAIFASFRTLCKVMLQTVPEGEDVGKEALGILEELCRVDALPHGHGLRWRHQAGGGWRRVPGAVEQVHRDGGNARRTRPAPSITGGTSEGASAAAGSVARGRRRPVASRLGTAAGGLGTAVSVHAPSITGASSAAAALGTSAGGAVAAESRDRRS